MSVRHSPEAPAVILRVMQITVNIPDELAVAAKAPKLINKLKALSLIELFMIFKIYVKHE